MFELDILRYLLVGLFMSAIPLAILVMGIFDFMTMGVRRSSVIALSAMLVILIPFCALFAVPSFSKYFEMRSLDKVTDSISQEHRGGYDLDKEVALDRIKDEYNITHVELESFSYDDEYSEYISDGTARFDGRMIDFSVSVGLDSEITLAPYSTEYSESDLAR